MFARSWFWIILLSFFVFAEEDGPETEAVSAKVLQSQVESLKKQLLERDKTIDILERQLNANAKKVALNDAIVETRDTEIENLKQIQSNHESLIKFQESQIEQLRQVIRGQRTQLNKLNQKD
jgi:septal ring factor EnvC (AmiA/AmiB activator)